MAGLAGSAAGTLVPTAVIQNLLLILVLTTTSMNGKTTNSYVLFANHRKRYFDAILVVFLYVIPAVDMHIKGASARIDMKLDLLSEECVVDVKWSPLECGVENATICYAQNVT